MSMTTFESRAAEMQLRLSTHQLLVMQTKREDFAKAAMQGYIMAGMKNKSIIAALSVETADELIKALSAKPPKDSK